MVQLLNKHHPLDAIGIFLSPHRAPANKKKPSFTYHKSSDKAKSQTQARDAAFSTNGS